MDIILTEAQYINLLVEKKNNRIENSIENQKNIFRKILDDVKEKHNLDFTFALTWGAVIGGFIGPIDSYLRGTYTNLSDVDVSLISFGIILTFFSSNKEKLSQVL